MLYVIDLTQTKWGRVLVFQLTVRITHVDEIERGKRTRAPGNSRSISNIFPILKNFTVNFKVFCNLGPANRHVNLRLVITTISCGISFVKFSCKHVVPHPVHTSPSTAVLWLGCYCKEAQFRSDVVPQVGLDGGSINICRTLFVW
jgi:hypothetical protein